MSAQELVVDLFAGGGGASVGIEMALGRPVDIAINHDADAVAMHAANHPGTRHLRCDVFEVDPREATGGYPVGLLWASPDCTYHSKSRGGKPFRDQARKRRALAWVVTRWAGQVRPRVIMLENVEEFAAWGPLVGAPGELRPCPRRRGRTFRQFVRSLERHGYEVEWRELRACDYGAPTIRKRLYLIARCDGEPITWPEPTHGPEAERPYRTAASCIDWTVPMCSIFATPEEAKVWARAQRQVGHRLGTPVRPLADATLRRVARGIRQYVIEAEEPYTLGAHLAPALVQTGYGERKGQAPRTLDLDAPLGTIVAGGGKHALVAVFLAKNFTGVTGSDLRDPLGTITTVDHHSLVAALLREHEHCDLGASVRIGADRYSVTDVALRMLQPHELYRAQGFPADYRIERGADGRRLTKRAQIRMCGNSVAPPQAAALVRANVRARDVRNREEVA